MSLRSLRIVLVSLLFLSALTCQCLAWHSSTTPSGTNTGKTDFIWGWYPNTRTAHFELHETLNRQILDPLMEEVITSFCTSHFKHNGFGNCEGKLREEQLRNDVVRLRGSRGTHVIVECGRLWCDAWVYPREG